MPWWSWWPPWERKESDTSLGVTIANHQAYLSALSFFTLESRRTFINNVLKNYCDIWKIQGTNQSPRAQKVTLIAQGTSWSIFPCVAAGTFIRPILPNAVLKYRAGALKERNRCSDSSKWKKHACLHKGQPPTTASFSSCPHTSQI